MHSWIHLSLGNNPQDKPSIGICVALLDMNFLVTNHFLSGTVYDDHVTSDARFLGHGADVIQIPENVRGIHAAFATERLVPKHEGGQKKMCDQRKVDIIALCFSSLKYLTPPLVVKRSPPSPCAFSGLRRTPAQLPWSSRPPSRNDSPRPEAHTRSRCYC